MSKGYHRLQQQQQQQLREEESKISVFLDDGYTNGNDDDDNNNTVNRCWVYNDFLKEKLRVRERYSRSVTEITPTLRRRQRRGGGPKTTTTPSLPDGDDDDENKNDLWIIPDGVIWRKYFPILSQLLQKGICKLILLESAVDLMDYRSMSPSVTVTKTDDNVAADDDDDKIGDTDDNTDAVKEKSVTVTVPESPMPQERSKIQKLIKNFPGRMITFCDLSVREEDHDEWDMMNYSTLNIEQRSRHALVRAASIIQEYGDDSHAGSTATTTTTGDNVFNIIILSSDDDFIKKFPQEQGIELLDIGSLLNRFVDNDNIPVDETIVQLRDRCDDAYRVWNLPPSSSSSSSNDTNYEQMTEVQVEEQLKNKVLVKGRLTVTKENTKEAFVAVPSGETYFINQQLGHFNRALHYDIVAILPLPESEWGRPVGRRRLVHHKDDDVNAPDETDLTTPPVPSARVVATLEPSRRQFVATVVDVPMNDESACLVVPMDMRIPKIRIKTNGWKRFLGHRLLVQIDAWDVGSTYPAGHCVEIIGPVADLETEISCLLRENELQLDPFSAMAQSCLPVKGNEWTIPDEEIKNRLDLRSTHRIFSVDPPGCQDIDDTMHARVLSNGDIEIGVHIADVTYFVPHNSALDIEAQRRGTTFYLVDRRFDMLPSLLSSDLCSLHGKKDRLAVSTIWTMSSDLNTIKSFWYGRTIIHNCQAMIYDQAHNILHDKSPDDGTEPPPLTAGSPVLKSDIKDLKHDLTILTQLARKLRKVREETGGAVDLSSGDQGSELKFTLDENNNPIKVTPKKQLEIHHTIAELMILANTWVAKTIHERTPDRALLRIHRSVDEDRFEDLKEIFSASKVRFDGSTNQALATSLKKAEKSAKSKSVMSLFQSIATRAMSEAQYICTGQVGVDMLSHYGLGLAKYTHFTSPIRRYADVVVHKQLLSNEQQSEGDMVAIDMSTTKINKSNKNSNKKKKTKKKVVAPLQSIPDSKTISIISGEGLDHQPATKIGELLDGDENDNIATTTKNDDHMGQAIGETQYHQREDVTHESGIYEHAQVTKICDRLNRQNRMAKLSSYECQGLFLSLYFKSHTETTQAVVTNLRGNGFWIYVPKFDIRGPVYLTDADGNLQIDPAVVKLPPTAGEDASLGFQGSGVARRFSNGICNHIDSEDERIEVTVPGMTTNKWTIRILDVITVKINCENWDARARVPSPRFHLISTKVSASPNKSKSSTGNTSQNIGQTSNDSHRLHSQGGNVIRQQQQQPSDKTSQLYRDRTVYSLVTSLYTPPLLPNEPFRFAAEKPPKKKDPLGKTSMTGRVIFGNFVNPDTHSAKQSASVAEAEEAAKQRRNHMMASQARHSEYDNTRRIEMEATARMQRLAASKRNARIGKSK